jgi:glycerophosphoryl diester phosphodiesterase
MRDAASDHPWVVRCRPRGRPLVFAHRGGAALTPENTMAAFDRAAELGADGLELDVRLAKDGEVVVMHDADLDRTTDATGPVASRTAGELAGVDAGFRFAVERGAPYRGRGLGVPRLADVLTRHRALPLVIELKGTDPALARAAVAEVRRAGALDRVCFGGFDDGVLGAARAEDAGVCTSAARDEIRSALRRVRVYWPLGRVAYRAFQVPETFGEARVASHRLVKAAHRAGLLVQIWTVNDEADMRRLAGWGADALITDRPDLALEVVGARRPAPSPALPAAEPTAAAPGR